MLKDVVSYMSHVHTRYNTYGVTERVQCCGVCHAPIFLEDAQVLPASGPKIFDDCEFVGSGW